MATRTEPIIILANKRSRGYRDVYRRHLLNVFAKRRHAPVFYLNPEQGDLFSSLTSQIKSAKQIIIAGGDGTFESALNHPLLQKKSLGFFPLGAGNSFYSYFYKGKRFEYLRSHFQFQETELDVLELEFDGKKCQTLFCSVGIDAEVIRFSKDRSQHGFFDYVSAAWRALIHAKSYFPLKLNVDDKSYDLSNCINLTIGKIAYYGFGCRSLILPVSPSNGIVYGLACLGGKTFFNKILRLWAIPLTALNLVLPPLLPLKGHSFELESKIPFPLQAGGEFVGFTSYLKVKVIRKQRVLTI